MKLFKSFYITGTGNEVHLIRHTIFSCKWFSLKIHTFLKSDEDCPHDHPWSFITFILKGGYIEHTDSGSKIISRFSLLYRKATHKHRIEIHQKCKTLVLTFKKTREWGFYTKKGWIEWKKFFTLINKERC